MSVLDLITCLAQFHVILALYAYSAVPIRVQHWGGIIPHFYRFFGILKFWGGYSGFVDFSSFNDFENLGVYSGFNENVLKQLKIRIRMHKINK